MSPMKWSWSVLGLLGLLTMVPSAALAGMALHDARWASASLWAVAVMACFVIWITSIQALGMARPNKAS
jgi:uncharacterized membrane protein YhaH (DUF805 family)